MPEALQLDELRAAGRRGAAFAQLLRPGTVRMPVLVFLAAGLGEDMGLAHVLGGVLLIVASYGVATILNDLHDLEIDRANGRVDRPLVTGALTEADARAALVVCAVAVVAAQLLLVQPLGLAVTAAAVMVGIAYSLPAVSLQSRGLWATAVLAVAYFVLPLVLSGAPLRRRAARSDGRGGDGDAALQGHQGRGRRPRARQAHALVRHGAAYVDRLATLLGVAGIAFGLVHAGPGWWTACRSLALAAAAPDGGDGPTPGPTARPPAAGGARRPRRCWRRRHERARPVAVPGRAAGPVEPATPGGAARPVEPAAGSGDEADARNRRGRDTLVVLGIGLGTAALSAGSSPGRRRTSTTGRSPSATGRRDLHRGRSSCPRSWPAPPPR